MRRRDLLTLALAAAPLAACASFKSPAAEPEPIPEVEHLATIAQMRPPKRKRPLAAILLDNRGSETTDSIVPWSVLKRSGVADVRMVTLEAGPAVLMPVLSVDSEQTVAAFDEAHPDGADYVFVPAYHDERSPAAIAWLRKQASGGATIVGICAGGLTLAHAGLLEGRRGTTHWFNLKQIADISPGMTVVPDRRYVADRGVITTTGVSASLPVSMAIVEAISGPELAAQLARGLGVAHYDARHLSSAFGSKSAIYSAGAANTLNLLGRRNHSLQVDAGVDELAVAFIADAWSRTYRGDFDAVAATASLVSQNGLGLVFKTGADGKPLSAFAAPSLPGEALHNALDAISSEFGTSTALLVAHQLEVIWQQG